MLRCRPRDGSTPLKPADMTEVVGAWVALGLREVRLQGLGLQQHLECCQSPLAQYSSLGSCSCVFANTCTEKCLHSVKATIGNRSSEHVGYKRGN